MQNSTIAKAVKYSLVFGAATAAFTGQAIAEEGVERIEVTGSRIKRVDMEGANPVQLITREDIVNSGISNVGDLLQEIPSVAGAATNTAINNGGSGSIRVSLRGLGSARTLVLLNGRRVVASGTGANSSVDLSTIPTAIIKRVEVLKDGASAVYGSDAIGGVVNIITRNDFEGLEFNALYDESTKGDGHTKSFDMTMGVANDKGNFVVNAYYTQQGEQWSGDRDWSAFEYDMDPDTGEVTKGGSSAPPWGRYNFEGPDGCSSFTHGAGSGPGQNTPDDFISDTEYSCWDWDRDPYNYAPVNYHLTPNERYGLFTQGSYEINDRVRVFTEASYAHRSSDTLLAPEPLAPLVFFGYSDAPYSADNYYNQTFGPKDADGNTVQIDDWRRRVVETGGRLSSYDLNTYRFMVGVDGEFDNGWGYEVYYSYGKNEAQTRTEGNFNLDKVALAVGPSFMDENGNVVCGTADNPIEGCVSLNVFGVPGTDTGITQEMLDYVTFNAQELGENEQQIISASVFGDLFELPAGPVGLAVGLEHREEEGADYPDALVALGVTTGSTRQPTSGGYTVDEAFFETTLPILSDAPLAETLELDAAVRYSDYDLFGDTTNYKLGMKWVPFEDVLIRATVSTAFRAPAISDAFGGTGITYPSVSDPCSSNPTQYCIADGVPAGGYEALGDQLRQLTGGNPDLEPEEADIFTVGFVYNPSWLEGFSFTVDYWDIQLDNAISAGIGPDIILNGCAETGQYCDQIDRFPDGNVTLIDDRTVNVGGVDSSGFDFNFNYRTDTDFGEIRVNLDSTYYQKYDKTLADGTVEEYAGWYRENGDGNFPEWKANLDVGLNQDDWSVNWSTRYIDSVEENWTKWWTDTVGHRKVSSQTIHDVRFTYNYSNYVFSTGLNNVFDRDPPFAANGFNDNTDPRTYNTTGRHWYVSVGARF